VAPADLEIGMPVMSNRRHFHSIPHDDIGSEKSLSSEGKIGGARCGENVAQTTPLPVWQRFLPALIFYPIWLRTMIAQDLWADAYSDGWPMAIAMIAGSLIAG